MIGQTAIYDPRELNVGTAYRARLADYSIYVEFTARLIAYDVPPDYEGDDYCDDPVYVFDNGVKVRGTGWRVSRA